MNINQISRQSSKDQDPEEWLYRLEEYLKLKPGPKKNQLLKLFFDRANHSLDANKHKKDENYSKLLAYHACFVSASNVENAQIAFKTAASFCRTISFIHIAFAQFELILGQKKKATEVLEYGLQHVVDIKEIKDAMELVDFDETDIGLLNDDMYLLCKENSFSKLQNINRNIKKPVTEFMAKTSSNINKKPLTYFNNVNRPITDTLDLHLSPQTVNSTKKIEFETPKPLDFSKMKGKNQSLINCLSMKTPSPPKFVRSPKKKESPKKHPLNNSVILPTPKNKINNLNTKLSASARPSRVVNSTSKSQGPVRVPVALLQRLNNSDDKENEPQTLDDKFDDIIPLNEIVEKQSEVKKPLSTYINNIYSTNHVNMNTNLKPTKPTDLIKQQWIETSQDFVINNKVYIVISQLGMGGSSKVFKVFDVLEKSIRAVKQVSLNDYDETVRKEFQNEISILQKLKNNSNIIHLYDYELTKDFLYIIMECGSADLSHLIKRREKRPKELQPYDIKHYFRKMLEAVKVVHNHDVVHLDLKPANFLLVEGHLKLIDFGIANVMQTKATSIIKETQFGTMNYMAPEALMDGGYQDNGPTFKISPRSDVWSLGCILYLMMYGKTPFQHITHQYRKMSAITNPKHLIEYEEFPDKLLLHIVKNCLLFDPKKRPTVDQLLQCF